MFSCQPVQGINDVAWDCDDRYLATASDDKTLLLWAAQTGERLRRLEGHTNFVFSCAFSPKNSSLVPPWAPPPDTLVRLRRRPDSAGLHVTWSGQPVSQQQRDLPCYLRILPLRVRPACRMPSSAASVVAPAVSACCVCLRGWARPLLVTGLRQPGHAVVQVSGSFDEKVCIWELKKGERIKVRARKLRPNGACAPSAGPRDAEPLDSSRKRALQQRACYHAQHVSAQVWRVRLPLNEGSQ